jgi:hypothetical protein
MKVRDAELSNAAVDDAVRHLQSATARWPEVTLPPLSATDAFGFTADTETLQLIASVVREISPRHVIEFGCGPTTELLAELGFEHGRMAVTTFEHDPWAAEELIAVAGGQAVNYRWFSFAICPLVARRCGERPWPVYDDGMIVSTVPYPADLVLITGPPQTLGGRGGMLYQALKYARPGTIILLLDVRSGEEEVVESWLRDLARHVQFVPPGLLRRHLAFVVHEPMVAPFTLACPAAVTREAVRSEQHSQDGVGSI